MKILKFLFLLPLLAIGAQALEPKVVMKPEASLKNGLYYVKGKLYDGTLKMLRYSVEDLYDVNAMGMVYPRLKPLPPTLIREIDVQGGTAVQYRDYFDGRDKPSNEYPLKNGVRDGTAKHYHADSGALMGESEYKNGVRDGLYRRYYFDEGGVLKQEGTYKADKREGIFTDYYASGEVSARSPYVGGMRNGEDIDYYKSGKIRGVRTYKNDKREGAEKWYYESGAVEETGEYKNDLKKHSARWVEIPLNPSAEQFCRIFFVMIDRLLKATQMQNGEREVKLHSVIVHETDTGYAQCFREDAYNAKMGEVNLNEIVFSEGVRAEWEDAELFEKIKLGKKIVNPKEV